MDRYRGSGRGQRTKARLNELVAQAAANAGGSDLALVLDGAEGRTSRALARHGIRCLAPNLVPETQRQLEGCCVSWCGRVEDFLRCKLPDLSLRLVFLDHTGSFASRGSHIEAAFGSGTLPPGAIFACTFSMRCSPVEDLASAGLRSGGQGHAAALHDLVRAVRMCAEAAGLEVEGVDMPGAWDSWFMWRVVGASSFPTLQAVEPRRPALASQGLNDYELFDVPQEAVKQHLKPTSQVLSGEKSPAVAAVACLEGDHVLGLAAAMAAWAKAR